ncbi:HD domain-containing protein [Methanosarcina sp. Mfa9]|uniref:HD domain-containing protein n=1 Tax=Methanosarcina sp. Mfa9 TaxID=3439063 RepID=UPI003F82BF2F
MEQIMKFLYEMGQMKKISRTGWWIAGVKDPESVAEHSFRVAIVGYVLAKLENVDPYKVAVMCLFHDIHEARLNDIHKIGEKYFNLSEAENQAFLDQTSRLPASISSDLKSLMDEFNACKSVEAKIANDADRLECLIQAREYQSQGYKNVWDWIHNCRNDLKTESAKKIADKCMEMDPQEWWLGLMSI